MPIPTLCIQRPWWADQIIKVVIQCPRDKALARRTKNTSQVQVPRYKRFNWARWRARAVNRLQINLMRLVKGLKAQTTRPKEPPFSIQWRSATYWHRANPHNAVMTVVQRNVCQPNKISAASKKIATTLRLSMQATQPAIANNSLHHVKKFILIVLCQLSFKLRACIRCLARITSRSSISKPYFSRISNMRSIKCHYHNAKKMLNHAQKNKLLT